MAAVRNVEVISNKFDVDNLCGAVTERDFPKTVSQILKRRGVVTVLAVQYSFIIQDSCAKLMKLRNKRDRKWKPRKMVSDC
jgi:hypothetical protein